MTRASVIARRPQGDEAISATRTESQGEGDCFASLAMTAG
jgi:hypothetical protein